MPSNNRARITHWIIVYKIKLQTISVIRNIFVIISEFLF